MLSKEHLWRKQTTNSRKDVEVGGTEAPLRELTGFQGPERPVKAALPVPSLRPLWRVLPDLL